MRLKRDTGHVGFAVPTKTWISIYPRPPRAFAKLRQISHGNPVNKNEYRVTPISM